MDWAALALLCPARVAEVDVDQGSFRARRWEAVTALAKHTAGVLETHAERLVTRA